MSSRAAPSENGRRGVLTIRVMTTTRRLGEREAGDSAVRRPRPKIERPPVLPLCPKAPPLCGSPSSQPA
jgi:hypothetical protein